MQEQITHPEQSFRLLRLEQPAFTNQRHRHAHLELTWIERGTGMRFVGDHVAPFASGDLVLLGPHLPHTWLSHAENGESACRVTVLQVAPELVYDNGVPELDALRELAGAAACGLQITGSAHAAVTDALLRLDGAPAGLARFAALMGVFATLCAHRAAFIPLAGGAAARHQAAAGAEQGRRIDRVIDWIGRRFSQPLTVAEAAALVHVTPAAFSRFFRREAGKGFAEYVNDVRCGEACILLAGTERAVGVVAQACGFETLSNFNRQFRRRHGLSPMEYRRERRVLR